MQLGLPLSLASAFAVLGETIPMPEGKQAHFSVRAVVGIGLSLAPLLGRCSVTTRGWAGQRSRPRRGRTCPKARPAAAAQPRGRAAVRRGALLGIPRWSRILRVASGLVIAARIFMRPWHFEHVSASVMNTLGAMARVRACTDGRVGVTACWWLRGKHQQKFSATRQYLLLTKRNIRHCFGAHGSPVSEP